MKTLRLQVSLHGAIPAVVRVLDVPAGLTVAELHDLLQAALGWTNSHLHQFVVGEQLLGTPDADWAPDTVDETTVRVRDLPEQFSYHYDFGDSWEHEVLVLGAGEAEPGLVSGHGACPPEDCGGIGGYADLQDVLADPAHPEYADMLAWTGGGLQPFDAARTAARVRECIGVVPESVRVVLDLLAAGPRGGVRLTPGGRLSRALVREVQALRPGWYLLGRPASVEEDLLPLAALHDVLRATGLARLSRGVLTPTRAAGDDVEIVRRLRAHFDPDSFEARLADVALGMLASTAGPCPLRELAERAHPMLGRGWSIGGQPITVEDVVRRLGVLRTEWEALDLITTEWSSWRAGPSARSLLPGASTLAHMWEERPGSSA